MSQALHILKKDARYLRMEIGLLIASVAIYALAEFFQINQLAAWILLAIAASFLIARAIHAEAIPGDRQFWISRPYRWKSLLGGKLLFILLFINLPVFIARLAILVAGGFPLISILPGLLWSQFLILFVFCLPVAAVAALTGGLVPFIFSGLVLVAVGLGMQSMMVPISSVVFVRTMVGPVQWVWDAMASIALVAAAVPIFWIQYRNRDTLFGRTLAIAVAALTAAAYLYIPWPVALAVQSSLPGQISDLSTIRAGLDPSAKRIFPGRGKLPGTQLDFPIRVTGVPDGMNVEADALAVSFQGAQGWSWESGPYDLPALPRSGNIIHGLVNTPNMSFDEARDRPVTMRASIYLTLFGNARTKTISLTDTPVDVMDGLQCASGEALGRLPNFYCRSPFRWPARRVYAKFDETDTRSFTSLISYSPFPSELSLDNVVFGVVGRPEGAREVTIISKEPLKNIRLDFEVQNIRLGDFVESARPQE